MSAFLGNMMIAIKPNISTKTANASANSSTNDITAVVEGGRGNYTYTWSNAGTTATVNNKNSATTKLTGGLALGKTTAYCTIYDAITGNAVLTPTVDVDWTIMTLTASTISAIKTYTGYSQSATVLDGINGTYSGSTSTSGINAGSYKTTITGTGDYTGTVEGTLTIGAATLNLTAAVTSFTYNGASQTLSYSVTGAGVDTGYSVSGTSSTNVGSYTATLTKSSTNYILGTTTAINWSIGKAILTITTSSPSMTYGSSVPSIGYSLSGLLGADTANVITNGNIISVGSAAHSTTGTSSSNVGTYPTITNVSGLLASNYSFAAVNGTLTITAATLNLTAAVTSFTYNGASQSLSYSVTGAGVDTGYAVSGTTASTNAGSYTATLSKTSTNYILGTSSINWSIGKAPITITSNNASMTYGSSLPTFGYTLSGFKGSDTSSVITGSVTHSTSGSSSSSAGTYTITPNVAGLSATNYTFTAANGTLTINKATLTASTINGSATFNGDPQSFSITGITGTYTDSPTATGTNEGSYTTTITGSGNYTGTVTGTLIISPATITLQGAGQSFTYNGTTQSPTMTIGGTARNNYSYTISGASATNAGTYTATITSTTSNYVVSPSYNSFTWTITQAAASSSPASGTTTYKVYDGTTKSATVISGLTGLSYTGSAVASGVNAGTYPTTIAFALGGNYSGSVTGYLVISQETGYVALYTPASIPAGDTNTKLFSDYLQSASSTITWSSGSPTGPGAADAEIQPGYAVRCKSLATAGFSITITATINDPNYTAGSDTKTIVFAAYVAPPSGGGGTAEDGTGGTTFTPE